MAEDEAGREVAFRHVINIRCLIGTKVGNVFPFFFKVDIEQLLP